MYDAPMKTSSVARAGVWSLALSALSLVLAVPGTAQAALDFSNAPDCSQGDVATFREVVDLYLGIKGSNPSVPSTYALIGRHKFSGGVEELGNGFVGKNWYPFRMEKQILSGIVRDFGVTNIADESDWNIHLEPVNGFESFLADAIPFEDGGWFKTPDGKFTIRKPRSRPTSRCAGTLGSRTPRGRPR